MDTAVKGNIRFTAYAAEMTQMYGRIIRHKKVIHAITTVYGREREISIRRVPVLRGVRCGTVRVAAIPDEYRPPHLYGVRIVGT
jgi:hypothetical protein